MQLHLSDLFNNHPGAREKFHPGRVDPERLAARADGPNPAL
jgi:hypothetical protein